ncbi:hypothetical protein [Nonomuraea longicatena]|uniref:Secreted protein n=1 Tax=Nonomuraea longicatena TaxID=83682 RepID=A0ABN1NPM3_9ACTN
MWLKTLLVGGAVALSLLGLAVLVWRGDLLVSPDEKVDSAALQTVRQIGAVQAEDSIESDYDVRWAEGFEIINTFVVDVGEAKTGAAIGKAASRLRGHGWVLYSQDPTAVMMKSAKWSAVLDIIPFDPEALRYHPKIRATLQARMKSMGSPVIISVSVDRS